MNKVIKAELKKMVAKPSIYILALLLAVIMVLGVFIYKPTNQNVTETEFSGSTVLQIYQNDFGDGNYAGIKAMADEKVETAKTNVSNYQINNIGYQQKIESLIAEFNNSFLAYNSYANLTVSADSYIIQARTKMVNDFKAIYSTVLQGLNLNKSGCYPIVSTIENYDNYATLYGEALTLLEKNTTNKVVIDDICETFKSEYQTQINECLNKLYYPTITTSTINKYTSNKDNTKYNIYNQRIALIMQDIEQLKNDAQSDNTINISEENIEKMQNLINSYVDLSNTFSNLINYELLNNALNTVSSTDKGNLLYLTTATKIDASAMLIKYNYLFDNNKNMTDFANPLTIGVTSNSTANGYDYAYFILKLFSFIIIAYAIMAGAHTIAGEIKEGSMRYLAIRPVNRTSIVFGKLFAIAIMSIILILFSGILSVLAGGFIYGFGSSTILTVFAGKYAITLHPIAMIAIYLLSLAVEVLVYLSLAMLFSCLIKSDILAVTIIMVIYLVNILLPMFTGSSIGWIAYYPFSHISLYALFGSSLLSNPNNMFNLLLEVKVYSTTSFALTIITILAIVVISNLISAQIFKRKEI